MLPAPTPAKSRLTSSGPPFSEGKVLATAEVCMMQTMAITSASGTRWPSSLTPGMGGSATCGSATDNGPKTLTPRLWRWNSATAMPARQASVPRFQEHFLACSAGAQGERIEIGVPHVAQNVCQTGEKMAPWLDNAE